MASRARRDIRRNLIFLFLLCAGLGTLIALVALVQGGEAPLLLPQERAQFLERRGNTADNGFSGLVDAWNALQQVEAPKCEELMMKRKMGLQRPPNPQSPLELALSPANYLNTFCPNDDPRFLEFMDKVEGVRATVQAALAKPFLQFSRSSITSGREDAGDMDKVQDLVRRLNGLAMYRSAVTGDSARALAIVNETISICQKLESSGSYELAIDDHHHGPPGRDGFFKVGMGLSAGTPWLAVPVLAKFAVDRNEPLDALLELTRPALEEVPDRSRVLTAYCMMLDDMMSGEAAPPNLRFDQRMMMALTTRMARKESQLLLAREADVRAAINGPLRDYPGKIREIAGDGGWFGPKFLSLQIILMNVQSVLEGRRLQAGLAVRLEAFRRDHGAYPEKLEELVPQYLAKLPEHPLRGKPFGYTRYPEGYTITEGGGMEPSPDNRRMRFRENLTLDMRHFPEETPAAAAPAPAK